ncbi:bifunctional DNA primase/polymerase [Conexibacter arvalis]|uniref:DNA primase/polymerase bifunctional N-terminal domain-containing protein n=1 Tax=Conexibacter arvalis TaxID=912552 RepID=A0A840IG44_9ACTN|nr:bifunctional DNA primase/polymerase [Conexibacter arvalis]MBB4663173.1 hypothetical protein [Conexibacter arvalis]
MTGVNTALELHQRGFWLIPLAAGSKTPNFRVLNAVYDGTAGWGGLTDRRASVPEITAWFEHDPRTNVGIVVTDGMVVVDVDDPSRFDHHHPPTPTVRTRRGFHLYFAGRHAGVAKTAWGEVRGTGSYVVAPPSVVDGHTYEWPLGLDRAELAPLPEWASTSPLTTRTNGPSRTSRETGSDEALTRSAMAVAAALRSMGRPDALDPAGERQRDFACLLPGHDDAHPSATVFRSASGAFRYRCRGCGANLSLARLFATVTTGRHVADDEMRGPTAARWLRRLWHQAGFEPVTIAGRLPQGVSVTAMELAAGFRLLAALRDDDETIPYTALFAAGWCNLDLEAAKAGLKELRACGWLRPTGPSRPGVGYLYETPSEDRAAESGAVDVLPPDRPAPIERHDRVPVLHPASERGDERQVRVAEFLPDDSLVVAASSTAAVGLHAMERTRSVGAVAGCLDAETEECGQRWRRKPGYFFFNPSSRPSDRSRGRPSCPRGRTG